VILFLDTSTPVCKLTLAEGSWRYDNEWQADRTLANNLLSYLQAQLELNGKTWSDISGLGAFKGPGSFTGLRIGLTVLNTIADSENIPIVGETDDNWQEKSTDRLNAGENEHSILPYYGSEAHITKPRK
jgi:tRNA threonylcarbamoyladenosine biosynthesis protein TsaB